MYFRVNQFLQRELPLNIINERQKNHRAHHENIGAIHMPAIKELAAVVAQWLFSVFEHIDISIDTHIRFALIFGGQPIATLFSTPDYNTMDELRVIAYDQFNMKTQYIA